MIQTYRNLDRAKRAVSVRSRNANLRGDNSQYAIRQLGPSGWVGGPWRELEKQFPSFPVVAQYSAGYSV